MMSEEVSASTRAASAASSARAGWERRWEPTTKRASFSSATGSTTSFTTHRMSNLQQRGEAQETVGTVTAPTRTQTKLTAHLQNHHMMAAVWGRSCLAAGGSCAPGEDGVRQLHVLSEGAGGVVAAPNGIGCCDDGTARLKLRHDAGLADADALLLHGLRPARLSVCLHCPPVCHHCCLGTVLSPDASGLSPTGKRPAVNPSGSLTNAAV